MLDKIAKLDAGVIRGLLVAGAGLAGIILSFFGVDETLFKVDTTRVIDGVLLLFTTGALVYIAYARINLPNPPLSDAAVVKTVERQRAVDAGRPVSPPPIPTARQGGFAQIVLLVVLALGAVLFVGCATPLKHVLTTACSDSVERCAKATADVYAVYQKQGLALVNSEGASSRVKQQIKDVDARATPIIHDILITTDLYLTSRSGADAAKLVLLKQQLETSVTDMKLLTGAK